jgi:hypothetical protein
MTIRQQGGIFGRNPTFNNVTVDGILTVDQIIEKTGAAGITLDGVTLKDGNVVLADGNGIDFSATAGTGTSELFDDYEEGTWTPLISADGAGAVTFTSTTAIGRYTKVGRLVTIYCRYTYTDIGSVGNNFAFMSGLPFASLNSGMEITGSMQIGQSSFLTRIFQPKMGSNSSLILFQYDNGTGALYSSAPYMVGNSFPASGDITILLSYFTA